MTPDHSGAAKIEDSSDREATAIIGSSHINALGIAQSLREIGWRGKVICLASDDDHPITEEHPDLCETWQLSAAAAADLPGWLDNQFPEPDVPKVIFFTNEMFHYQFASHWGNLPPDNVHFKVGCAKHLDTVLDRLDFYDFITSRSLGEVPLTLPGSDNPWNELEAPFYLRVRRSWQGTTKLPRGKMVNSQSEVEKTISDFRAEGMDETDWAYQEALSTAPQDNLSVCGWHDDSYSLYLTTKPIVRKKDASAVVVEFCDPPGNILETTRSILLALDYAGPFELEFIRDTKTKQLKVLELNPRFWMQHRLIAEMTDNALVRRYLGQNVPESHHQVNAERVRWVDGLATVQMLRVGNPEVLSHIGRSPKFHPPLSGVLKFFSKKQIRRRFRSGRG